jgi:hypothetical protein
MIESVPLVSLTPLQALKDAGQPHLVEKLSRSLGHGIGIEFRESLSLKTDSMKQDVGAK